MSVTLEQLFVALAESTVKVGLAGPDRQEIEADWYERQPLAAEVTWQVEGSVGEWLVSWFMVFEGPVPRLVPLSEPVLVYPGWSGSLTIDVSGGGR